MREDKTHRPSQSCPLSLKPMFVSSIEPPQKLMIIFFTLPLWPLLYGAVSCCWIMPEEIQHLFLGIPSLPCSKPGLVLVIGAVLRHIWKGRNARILYGRFKDLDILKSVTMRDFSAVGAFF
ncbi:hypothetical protein AMTRI_Chr06g173320 [Amborella trichopoda]